MPAPQLFTYKDLIDHLVDYLGDNASKAALRDARRAAQDGYRELASAHQWTYYMQRGRIVTSDDYTTGTVAYDHCVTPEHEALTRNGWKTYDQLKVGEEILAYNHDTETCSWQAIEKLHINQYSGDVLEVTRKGRTVLRCTPNHRIPVYERFGKPRRLRKKFVTAAELTEEHFVPLAAPVETESGDEESCRLAAILGWLVTDGHGLFKAKSSAAISQSNAVNLSKCREIEHLVGRPAGSGGPGKSVFTVKPPDRNKLREMVKDKGDLPRHFCTFGVEEAESAVYAMIQAEASTQPANGQKVFAQWNRNAPVAEAFQIACLLTGRAANICVNDFDGGTRYAAAVRHSKHIKLKKQSEWVHYEGVTWCPQVRTGAWVVRCNGAVMITGNSGGAYERMVTLTTGTWPSWAALGQLVLDNIVYQVAERKSDSIITLTYAHNPGADVDSGETYTLYRDSYPMPSDFQAAGDMLNASNSLWLRYVEPNEWMKRQRVYHGVASPSMYTFTSDENYMGSMAVRFFPPPDDDYAIDFLYKRRPRQLYYDEVNAGTATNSAASTTVTGSGTAWSDRMVGSVLRLSASTTVAPTGLTGANVYDVERVITAVASTTSLTVDSSITDAHTAVKYTISDPVDVEDGAMLTALLRCCEKQNVIARIMKNAALAGPSYRDALIQARESDSRYMGRRVAGGVPQGYRLSDMPSGDDAG